MPPIAMSARGWNRALLARQLLLERVALSPQEAVGRLLAVQSQSPPSAYLALWNRVAGFDPAALDAAYAERRLVKASLLRVTLQTVRAGDLGPLATAMHPVLRASRLHDARFADGGIARDEALAATPEFLAELAEPRTNEHMEAWTQARFGEHPTPSVWWAMRYLLPLVHAPTGGPWSFGARPAFAASGLPAVDADDAEALRRSQEELVRRYLAVFGPAAVGDIAKFSVFLLGTIRPVLERLRDDLVEVAVQGRRGPFWDLKDADPALRPDPETPAPPRLLGMWDDAMLGCADRSRTLPAEIRKVVVRSNGDVLPTLLVDGYAAGVWRVAEAEGRHRIQAYTLLPITESDWQGLEAEAIGLLAMLADREPAPYARYDHWFRKDIAGLAIETRLLG